MSLCVVAARLDLMQSAPTTPCIDASQLSLPCSKFRSLVDPYAELNTLYKDILISEGATPRGMVFNLLRYVSVPACWPGGSA